MKVTPSRRIAWTAMSAGKGVEAIAVRTEERAK
jgi:hypothetical protein